MRLVGEAPGVGNLADTAMRLACIGERHAATLKTPRHDQALQRRTLVGEKRVRIAHADARRRGSSLGIERGIMEPRLDHGPQLQESHGAGRGQGRRLVAATLRRQSESNQVEELLANAFPLYPLQAADAR